MAMCRLFALGLFGIGVLGLPAPAVVVELVSVGVDIRTSADFTFDAPSTPIFGTFSANGIAVDSIAGKVYWSESTAIVRADEDGSNPETILSPLSGPEGVAVDGAGGKLYWADAAAGSVNRANLDGSASEALATGLGSPTGIALDHTAGKVYWTELDSDTIGRANLDGSGQETFLGVSTGLNAGLTVDGSRGRVYWFDTGVGSIYGADIDGSNQSVIDSPASTVSSLAFDEQSNMLFVSLASASPRIDLYELDSGARRVAAVVAQSAAAIAFGGTSPALWWSVPSMNAIRTAPFAITGLLGDVTIEGADVEVDVAGAKMYWTEWDTVNAGARVMRAELDGMNVETLFPAETSAYGVTVHVSAGKLYWTDPLNDRIYRSDLDGANRETIVDGAPAAGPTGIDINPSTGKVYWTNSSGGGIGRADLDGQNAEVLVSGLSEPWSLAVDGLNGRMYWTDRTDDSVRRANLDGTNVVVIAATLELPVDIEVDPTDGKLYWSQFAGNAAPELHRADVDGSNVTLLANAGLWPGGIALNLTGDPGFQGSITSNIHPSNIRDGDHLILTAPAGSGYQWKLEGADLPGATGATMEFPAVAMTDAGEYTVTYDNGFKAVVDSLPFELVVLPPLALPLAGGAAFVLSLTLAMLAHRRYSARGAKRHHRGHKHE